MASLYTRLVAELSLAIAVRNSYYTAAEKVAIRHYSFNAEIASSSYSGPHLCSLKLGQSGHPRLCFSAVYHLHLIKIPSHGGNSYKAWFTI